MTQKARRGLVASAFMAAALLAVASAVAVLLRQWEGSSAPAHAGDHAAGGPRVLMALPEFALEDERRETVGRDDLLGRVWVAGFIFTRCAGTCPMITHRMAVLSKELAADPSTREVRLVSLSVDPGHDTPAVLEQYARAHYADRSRWIFLTGARDAVLDLVRDGFRLPVEAQDDPIMPIIHSQQVVLVDRAGRIRGAYDLLADEGYADLRRAIGLVAGETAPADHPMPSDAADERWFAARRDAQAAAADSIAAPHDFRFRDRLGASGIAFRNAASVDLGKYYRPSHYDHGTAVATADVDGDGRPDLYFANQAGPNALYLNRGEGRFADFTAEAGVAVGDRASVGAAFADVDNDGDPDLFVTTVREGNLLFENDGTGKFTDVTREAGLAGNGEHASGAVFFDADGDGRLDLFVTSVGRYTGDERRDDRLWVSFPDAFAGHLHAERSEPSILYRNLGRRFEAVPESSGLAQRAWSGDATPFDTDGDGRSDLYVLSMQGHDELWRNLGSSRFERRGADLFPDSPWGSMGVKVLDWNADGRLDLFVTDMHTDMAGTLRPEDDRRKHDPATMFPERFLGTDGRHVLGNALYTSQGDGRFVEMSEAANVETGWPWGPSAGDLNADGFVDLFIAAGMNFPHRYRGNDLLLNEGGKRFANAEFLLGVEPRARRVRPWFALDCDRADADHPICRGEAPIAAGLAPADPMDSGPKTPLRGAISIWAARASRSAVILDLDGDGDLDIVTNNYGDLPQILVSDRAQQAPVRYITVRLVGQRSNRDGLGAIVTVRAGGREQVQAHDGKSGYLAQSALPLYFGLGAAARADSITVRWPSGRTQAVPGPFRSGSALVVEER